MPFRAFWRRDLVRLAAFLWITPLVAVASTIWRVPWSSSWAARLIARFHRLAELLDGGAEAGFRLAIALAARQGLLVTLLCGFGIRHCGRILQNVWGSGAERLRRGQPADGA